MSKKLAAKSAKIEMPAPSRPAVAPEPGAASQPRTRTAVGGMAQFVTTQSPVHREAEALRKIVDSYEGARVVRAIQPTRIAPSSWANRHEDAFHSEDFTDLKREIREAGSNVQPIKVRPLNGSTPGSGQGAEYEIVFGHRRHRACLELGIPVNAMVEEVDDRSLFEQMERENRGRKNLSAWEQGRMYQAALDTGLYASQRKLSESIGVDVSLISKSLALAKLPEAVMRAFASPLDVQFRWAQPLGEALQKNPEHVVATAKAITAKSGSAPLPAAEVFARLTSSPDARPATGQRTELKIGGKVAGEFAVDSRGGVALKIKAGALSPERRTELLASIEQFLQSASR